MEICGWRWWLDRSHAMRGNASRLRRAHLRQPSRHARQGTEEERRQQHIGTKELHQIERVRR